MIVTGSVSLLVFILIFYFAIKYRRTPENQLAQDYEPPKVLEAAEESLGLKNGEIQASWDCLRRVGNLSSASVLCVLEDVMLNRRPQPGTLGVLAALGPGFCSEVVLLRW